MRLRLWSAHVIFVGHFRVGQARTCVLSWAHAMLGAEDWQPGPSANDGEGRYKPRPATGDGRAERRGEDGEEQGRSQEMAPAKRYDVGGLTADSAPGSPEDAPQKDGGLAYTPTSPCDVLPIASIHTKMPSGTGVVDAFRSPSLTLFPSSCPVLTHAPSQTSFAMERTTPPAPTTTPPHTLNHSTNPLRHPLGSNASVTWKLTNRSHSSHNSSITSTSTSTNPRTPPSTRRRSSPSSRRNARPRTRCQPTRASRITSCSIRWESESSPAVFHLPISSARAVEARHGRALPLHRATQLTSCCSRTPPASGASSGASGLCGHGLFAQRCQCQRITRVPSPPIRSLSVAMAFWRSCLPMGPRPTLSPKSPGQSSHTVLILISISLLKLRDP